MRLPPSGTRVEVSGGVPRLEKTSRRQMDGGGQAGRERCSPRARLCQLRGQYAGDAAGKDGLACVEHSRPLRDQSGWVTRWPESCRSIFFVFGQLRRLRRRGWQPRQPRWYFGAPWSPPNHRTRLTRLQCMFMTWLLHVKDGQGTSRKLSVQARSNDPKELRPSTVLSRQTTQSMAAPEDTQRPAIPALYVHIAYLLVTCHLAAYASHTNGGRVNRKTW